MAGGKGAPEEPGEERRVAVSLAAIAAYRRDKSRAERASAGATQANGGNPWKEYGKRRQMRGGLS